jgi:STE24 endopeptidase
MWSDRVPDKLSAIIDADSYKKSQQYYKVNSKFSHLSSTVSLTVILAVLFLAGFSLIDNFLRNHFSSEIIISILFFGIIGFAADILSLPFAWYSTFKIEERFGFNRSTTRLFIIDHLKSWLLMILIGGPLLALISWLYYISGDMFWIYAWVVMTLFSLFMTFFYSKLIAVFNKLQPLEPGSLRDGIESLASKSGFKLQNIFVIDGSKRSTKSNAFFYGFGSRKRIVLYDTLLSDLDEEEVIAVLAHEIGHYRLHHSLVMLFAGIAQTGLLLFLFSLLSGNQVLANALGTANASFHISLLAFMLIYSPVSLVISLILNALSRSNEFAADRFASGIYDGKKLSSSLCKLSVKNLSNMNPHPAYVFFYYSHPPLLERLKHLE